MRHRKGVSSMHGGCDARVGRVDGRAQRRPAARERQVCQGVQHGAGRRAPPGRHLRG